MQKSNASAFPTIIFEDALRREMEYRKRLQRTHPHLLIALNGDPERHKVIKVFFVMSSIFCGTTLRKILQGSEMCNV